MARFEDGALAWRRPIWFWIGVTWLLAGPLNPSVVLFMVTMGFPSAGAPSLVTLVSVPSALGASLLLFSLGSTPPASIDIASKSLLSAIITAACYLPIIAVGSATLADLSGPGQIGATRPHLAMALVSMVAMAATGAVFGAVFWAPAAIAAGLIVRLVAFRLRSA